jgi:hypothetical protein
MQQQDMKDDTGTLNRFGDSVLKVAMILSLARSPELYIDEGSMNTAIDYCRKLIGNMREMTHGQRGLSESSHLKSTIIKEFLNRDQPTISRAMLLKKMWAHYKEAHELDEIMLSFDQSGVINTQSIGNQIVYTMSDSTVQEYRRMWSGRNK